MSQTYVFARNAPDAEYDRGLTWAALLLAAGGLVMVYSASIATAEASRYTGYNAAWYLARHGVFLGVAFTAALARSPKRRMKRPQPKGGSSRLAPVPMPRRTTSSKAPSKWPRSSNPSIGSACWAGR